MTLSQQLGWIGVDVGTHTVKLAQAARDGAGVRLHRAAVIQRPTSWRGDDALALEQTISSSPEISAALECGGFIGRNAIGTLPMNVCQLRGLKVPPGSDQERRTIIADELAEDWTELRNAMEFDFWEMETQLAEKGSDGFNVTVLAASRPWVAQLWRDCRKSGMDCWAVDGVPLAMARAVALAGGTSGGQRTLAVDWGYSSTTLCVIADDRPVYTRRIHDCSFGRVLDAIVNTFDVTLDEAQHLADTHGLAPSEEPPRGYPAGSRETDISDTRHPIPDAFPTHDARHLTPDTRSLQAAITGAAGETLDELVRQISRTLQFMEAQRRHLHPAAVWLLGGGASMRNIAPYMTHALALPVHVWKIADDELPTGCAAGHRCALFGSAVALSAAAWRAA